MTQATTWSVPTVGPATPTVMAQRTDDSFDALLSGHSGSARPSYAVAGTVWEDTSVAGTVKHYFYDGSDDILLWSVNTSTNVVTWANVTAAASQAYGQCQLALSGGNLVLSRRNGRLLTINGAHYEIPSAGVTLAPSGLTPSTLYFIYALMNSGTMTLEASSTGPSTDSATGMQIKTGDSTRTLVGMAYPETGPVFTDTANKRFVRSWFNDPGARLINNFTANRTRASGTPAELHAEIRCEFLIWSGELATSVSVGSATNNTANGGNTTVISFDGTTPEVTGSTSINAVNNVAPFSAQAVKDGLSQGYHYATLMGYTSAGGTGTWYGDVDGRRTSLSVAVHR